jgi:hypothetical protein
MKAEQYINFDAKRIKEILTTIKEPESNFEVFIKNERLRKRNQIIAGTYNYHDKVIKLYLPEAESNNQLIQVAIHEYAHHFMRSHIGHKLEFWMCYFDLLEIAEKKGFFRCSIETSDKLKKITNIIKQYNLVKSRKIFRSELSWIFGVIKILCKEFDIDFEYYTVKYLEMEWYKKKDPILTYRRLSEYTGHLYPWFDWEGALQKLFNDYSI